MVKEEMLAARHHTHQYTVGQVALWVSLWKYATLVTGYLTGVETRGLGNNPHSPMNSGVYHVDHIDLLCKV